MSSSRGQPGQPYAAIGTGLVAGGLLVASWLVTLAHGTQLDARNSLLMLSLFAALILSYHFPVHVNAATKVYMGSIVLYLTAALLPPAIAASAIGVGILAGELSICQRTGNHRVPTLIPTQVSRWVIIGLGSSLVAHLPLGSGAGALIAGGLVMWSGDIVTGPLVLSPLLRQNPLRVAIMMVREGGVFEGTQYLIAILGALEARSQPWSLLLLLAPAVLVYLAFSHVKESRAQTRDMLEEMASMADARDGYSRGHSERVAELTRRTLESLGERGPESDLIVFAARVHDIGKLGIPDELLRSPAGLGPVERTTVQLHAEQGAELLNRYSSLERAAVIIRHHHEAWDGSGYPHRIAGEEIPLGSRIVAVAETFDNLTNDRPYRAAVTVGEAAAVLREGRGRQWDPRVVDAFLRTMRDEIELPVAPRLRLVRSLEAEQESG
ncbi:MAG TPA: HD domain-containing phosphohydrolase [Chloroflexota bacterium]|nr:HD domain-containing phosphohydrolase [Chloroflexota bacterium]